MESLNRCSSISIGDPAIRYALRARRGLEVFDDGELKITPSSTCRSASVSTRIADSDAYAHLEEAATLRGSVAGNTLGDG